jgi:hypothetical protein
MQPFIRCFFDLKTGNFYTGNRVGHRSLKVLEPAAGKGFVRIEAAFIKVAALVF